MAVFLVRLIGPRPTFPFDMTEAERAVMGRHFAHCQALVDEGAGIAFGPVLDPGGPWGLGLIEAEDEAALDAILARDPVIAEGHGFRYEKIAMPNIILRPGLASRPAADVS